MALVSVTGTLQNTTLAVPIFSSPTSNSTLHHSPAAELTARNPSWASRVLNYIPGFHWIMDKLGFFFNGPTYGMTGAELKEYKISMDREQRKENLRKDREAEFQVAKYMAKFHPDF